jgi:hypothetical protein
MASLKGILTVTALGLLVATPALAQVSGTPPQSPGTLPGTSRGGLTPSNPPANPSADPSASPAPPRPIESTPAPGVDNPTGAIPGTLGNAPSGIGTGGASSGAITTPRPQGGTAPSTTPGTSTIQR